MRIRLTVRSTDWELRGYTDDATHLVEFAEAMKPFGLVVASVAEDDYDPFKEWT
jgi:hypothetical protein